MFFWCFKCFFRPNHFLSFGIFWKWANQSCKKLIHLHFFRIQKFTPKMRDSWQIQHYKYKKCVIRDISILKRLKKSVKQSQTKTLLVSRCYHKHLTFFTPPFITFSTMNFTRVGKSLYEQRSYRSHLFAALLFGYTVLW